MGLQEASYFLFLGLVAVVSSVVAPRWRVAVLFAASLFFYARSSPEYLVLFLALSTLNYWAAVYLSRDQDFPGRGRIFGAILALDLVVLFVFKYLKYVVGMFAAHPGSATSQTVFKLALPLGISYFTFQMVACVTDAYRRDFRAGGGWLRFMLFGVFFPQITSGPIPRAGRLLPQLSGELNATAEDREAGLRLIAYGLFKQYVVANRLSDYVEQIFSQSAQGGSLPYSTLPTILACVFNALNLYANFSGYVDIARGSARVLGIHLDLNFDRPFISTSVSEFWRRWHMTLSFWLRDYIYMPLLIRIRELGMTGVIIALIITFAICGLWHDAAWTYLFFGVAQGVAMSAELLTKRWRTKRLKLLPSRAVLVAGWLYTMTFFVLSEVFFRASSLANAWQVFGSVFQWHLPHNVRDVFVNMGPFNFLFDLVAVGAWLGVSQVMRRESTMSTPIFVFVCALLILFLGQLGTAHFIYAGF
jgi:D-alanyl-lipoteichoic acid acyltransferase DltB (MBOAT superfamily)